MPQISKGDTFADGQQVTGARLNQLVDSATILPALITDQTAITAGTLASTDSTIVYNTSTLGLRKVTVSDLVNTGASITTGTINSTNDTAIVPTQSSNKTGASYVGGTTSVTVTYTAHGLAVGQCVNVYSATNTAYQGIYRVLTVPDANTFTYSIDTPTTAGNGTCNWRRSPTLKVSGNEQLTNNLFVNNNLYVDGYSNITGNQTVGGDLIVNSTSALKLPVGTTSQRPSSPVVGQLRFNTSTSSTEIYNGATWGVVGGNPFDATGGNTVIAPDRLNNTSCTFTSTDGIRVTVFASGHTLIAGNSVIFTTSVGSYSGTWTITDVTTNYFSFNVTPTQTPVTTSINATYKLIRNCTFTSTDGLKVTVTSIAHSVTVGTTVEFNTSVSLYSGTWTIVSITTDTFVFYIDVAGVPVTGASATYLKNFKWKCHIFTSSGTFTPTNLGSGVSAGEIEVLVVGGGGGGWQNGSVARAAGGGGGGVIYLKSYKLNSLSSISVSIGSGGGYNTVGNSTSFGTLIANGGGTYPNNSSGSTNVGGVSNAGGNNSSYHIAGGGYYPSVYTTLQRTSTGIGDGWLGGIPFISNISGEIIRIGAGGNSSYYQLDFSNYNSGSNCYGCGGNAWVNNGTGGNGTGNAGSAGIVIIRYPFYYA